MNVRTRASKNRSASSKRDRHPFVLRTDFSWLCWGVIAFFSIVSLIGGAEVRFDIRGISIAFSAVVFSIFAAWHRAHGSWAFVPTALKCSILLLAGYALIQVIPLPPAVWHALPGQALRFAVLDSAGLSASWQPISLTPIPSLYSAIMIIAFAWAFFALIEVPEHEYRAIASLIILFTAIGIAIGIVQISTGGTFPRIYRAADHTALIGLYANKNHMGLAMSASLVLAYFLLIERHGKSSSPRQLAFYGYWAMVVLALPLTNSRAGVVFGLIASAAITWSLLEKQSWKLRAAAGATIAALAAIFAVTPLPQLLLNRFTTVTEDDRWEIFSRSASLLPPYKFFGSGLGSFRELFATAEKIEWVEPSYINNAHNDYLQIILEMGAAGGVIVATLTIAILATLLKLRSVKDDDARHAAWVGAIIVILFALHSFVDYPLRRPAAVAVFLVSLAGIIRIHRPASYQSGLHRTDKNR